jgi:tRNA-2-methylthio-N6-dimethylallyladenosine synthase
MEATGVERIRFATSHPKDLSDEVIERFATLPHLMPALHLPVQSGSDRILQAMNRRYTQAHYLDLIRKLRCAQPDIALSTDIIVGFPGETEEDFQHTLQVVEEVGYHQVFSFIYSKREGTPAATYSDEVSRQVSQERFERLLKVVEAGAITANRLEEGSLVEVLVEGASKKDAQMLSGKTPKGQTVHAPLPQGATVEDLRGTIIPVRITQAKTWYLSGEVHIP